MASKSNSGVAKGGIWNTRKADISEGTMKMLNDENSLPPTADKTKLQSKQSNKKSTNNNGNQSRSVGSGKRRKDTIDAFKAQHQYEDKFIPVPGKLITDEDKEKLQNKMAYGDDYPALMKQMKRREIIPVAPDVDRFEEVTKEIEERREFLEEMESLGKGKQYKAIIDTEIAQKIQELVKIDKERTQELEEILKDESEIG